ncbi:MAG: imidazole glycerol phosphate synthase cyclase subunit [Anaerolinea sp.]|nr:imidazole glycerol phosphate synthase cyclase subunit [Anaerolinea sp.]
MLKKRMIFALLYNQGAFMLSRNFRLQKVGDLLWLQKNYDFSRVAFSIDELIVLDVSRGNRDLSRFCEHLKALTEGCFVPIAAGGGVRSVANARTLLRSGADKVVINAQIFNNPQLIDELAAEFGRQCVVASVDAKSVHGGGYQIWTENGSRCIEGTLAEWLKRISQYAVGDLYLNSIDRDGTGQGYDLGMLDHLPDTLPMPVIIAGGAGKYDHLVEGLKDNRVDAVSTAHLFNFIGDGLEHARGGLIKSGHKLPVWDYRIARELKGFGSNTRNIF